MINSISMLRQLKGAPLSIVLALQIVHQRVTQSWLEQVTGYTDKPIADGLAYLREVGYVDHTRAGWQLVGQAVQLPMPMEQIEAQISEEPVDNLPETVDNYSDTSCQGRNNSDSTESQLVVIKQDTDCLTSNLQTPPGVGEIPTLAEVRQVLDAAEVLFGVPILGDPRQYADLDRLLGWIAQAYHGRRSAGGKVTNPPGLIFWAIKHNKPPNKKYVSEPDKYLPESFLRACGQWEFGDET